MVEVNGYRNLWNPLTQQRFARSLAGNKMIAMSGDIDYDVL